MSLQNPIQCMLQVSSNTLQQVEKFKYIVVAFTSDGKRNKEIDTRIGKCNSAWALSLCGDKTGAFKHRKAVTAPGRIGEARTAGYTQVQLAHDVIQGSGKVIITSPILPVPVLMWSQQNYLKLLLTVRYFDSSWGCCLRDPPNRNRGHENECMNLL